MLQNVVARYYKCILRNILIICLINFSDFNQNLVHFNGQSKHSKFEIIFSRLLRLFTYRITDTTNISNID